MKKPFLRQVAEIYASQEAGSLSDYCFVFPNKRSATFFSHFLAESLDKPVLAPATTTISEFVASFSPYVEANRYEQLFTLFNAYNSQPGVEIDFDHFLFWGEMLINDFNDVDRYLVSPEALFVNVRKLREISSNYLTPEQQKVIERFWGDQSPHSYVEHFWNHLEYGDETSGNKLKFIKLWEVLLPLYNDFNSKLAERGLSSSGRLYRNAVECLSPSSDKKLPFRRYIFVGFNVLSTSEIEIFSRLQRRDMADFYWDFNSPAFNITENKARRFISRNIKEFPSRYPLEEETITALPKIKIIGVPSSMGQVKEASVQISEWIEEGEIKNTANATDTAVVLPDESLFIPMIHSMPAEITSLNVTMGFPMRMSPVASLLRSVISLQLRMRLYHGKPSFFYEDVKPLLASPIINKADIDGCLRLGEEIRNRRLFQITAEEIAAIAPGIATVFTPIGNMADFSGLRAYINRVCDFINRNADENDTLGLHFSEAYRNATEKFCNAAVSFGIDMNGYSLFQMVERAVNSDSVNFVGEPLAGLQMMGVLETRALDFRNIIMLSMNERVFPRKHYTRSFIPDALRRGYGMATLDFQESIYAYYFYRLISRASNVTLLYDARRIGGIKSNEMSRYLSQLLYLFGTDRISHTLGIYRSATFSPVPVKIEKNEKILNLLKQFTPQGGRRNLSASSINTYINCPLEFYLRYVEGYNPEDEITDYVDFSTFGTILHEVMRSLYQSMQPVGPDGKKKPVTVTQQMLDRTIDDPTSIRLDRLITRTVNRCFYRYGEERLLTPLAGETLVLSRIIKAAVIEMLKIDRSYAPFEFVAAEYEMQGALKINESLEINIKQIVDRIDIVDGKMRFIDYKTGDDRIDTSSVEDLFDRNASRRAKAVMQLLLYCHVFNRLEKDDRPIKPLIYKMRTLMTEGVKESAVGIRGARSTIQDYHDFYDSFQSEFNRTIEEIFNPDIPFVQAEDDHACKFCQFKPICSREEK